MFRDKFRKYTSADSCPNKDALGFGPVRKDETLSEIAFNNGGEKSYERYKVLRRSQNPPRRL